MLLQYAYLKPRCQFGKQCFFAGAGPNVEENILPDPKLTENYVFQTPFDRKTQNSTQFAVHEAQTINKSTKSTGTFHAEGGWPKEINPKDVEATQRFRRRAQREDSWSTKLKNLLRPMEHCILQNNAVNIHENYFDDMFPTPLVKPQHLRTSNVYTDPEPNVRPVSHLSWSPGDGNRLAATYSFMEFEVSPNDVNPCSYIWDIDNPNKALMTLESFCPLRSIEFNPRDPSMLISGLMSGQVCNWDIRTGNRPVQISRRQFSHRNPANHALWITSKTNTEFFSASPSGMIKWWDIRNLKEPTDNLVMDLEDPARGDIVRAIGVSALQFEPTVGSRFMAGMENGIVVNANRRGANPTEKLAGRFDCHNGPVVAIDRNPFSTKNFLTIGDWTAKVWADDTRENCLLATRKQDNYLTGGCWSRSRHSVFFTINTKGLLEIYDILSGMAAIVAFRVCENGLTAISPHQAGQFLAIGSRKGDIYLVECSEGLTINFKNDRTRITAYLDRCSRYEKAVDSRLKEIRLALSERPKEQPPQQKERKRRSVRGEAREKVKIRDQERGRDRSELGKKRSRSRKSGKSSSAYLAEDAELAEAEMKYFRMIEMESEKFKPLEDYDGTKAMSILQQSSKKRRHAESEIRKLETEERGKLDKKEARKLRRRFAKPSKSPAKEQRKEEEMATEIEVEIIKTQETSPRQREDRIFKKVCEVCEPDICCMDTKEGLQEVKSRKPTETRGKGKILMARSASPEILSSELREAKSEANRWRRRITSARRSPEKPVKTAKKKSEEEHTEKREGFEGSAEISEKCESPEKAAN